MILFNPRIAHAASKTDEREELHCVRIANGKATACNGFLLAHTPVTGDTPELFLLAQDVLNAGEDRHGNVRIEAVKGQPEALIIRGQRAILSEGVAIETHLLEHGSENNYPATRRLAYVAIGIEQLRTLLDCCLPEVRVIKLRIHGPNSQIEFVAGEIWGAFMPIYATENDGHWHKPKEEVTDDTGK